MTKDNNKFAYEIIKATPLYTINPLTRDIATDSDLEFALFLLTANVITVSHIRP